MGKKLMRKMLAFLAAVCMLASMSLTAFAVEGDTESTAAGVTGTTEDPTDGICILRVNRSSFTDK